ncbi:hypothetical protein HAX54_029197, partial [Datura stramonium]|nr:hypothetical protein [Datura stramonium]
EYGFTQGEVDNVFAESMMRFNYASAIVPPSIYATYIKINGSMYYAQGEGQFHYSTDNSPHVT